MPRPENLPGRLRRSALPLCFLVAAAAAPAAAPAEDYPVHPDSIVQAGVPKGETIRFVLEGSRVFPGTSREVFVYVPRQYDPARPACVYVNQDRVQWNAPVVFDNLIARGEIPVLIGVFVAPGVVKAAQPAAALDRFNRSFEYDGLGDAYARFVLDELLPFVETRQASDGRPLRLSRRGEDRAIGGSSSGAIAAWTVAWERPDAFSRVFSAIGTFVSLRGGDRYPGLIRKYEPKPIRVFLQGGSNDNNIYGGDWWMANQTMQRALEFAGYDVRHVWGEGGHNGKHGTALFPDAIRWLWRDWPGAVQLAAPTRNTVLSTILIPGEEWQLVSEGHQFTEGPAVNAAGEVFFNDLRAGRTLRVGSDGKVLEVLADSRRANGQHFGPDGRRYAVATQDQEVVAYDASGVKSVLARGIAGNDLVVARNGDVYVTNPPAGSSNEPSKVWLLRPGKEPAVVDAGLRFANGVTLSPDQTLLYVADYRSHWVYSYQIRPDGTLAHKQRYFHLHEPDEEDMSFADGLRCDREGRLYVATRLGIQVCDQAGRVNAIIPVPNGRVSNLCFGGARFDTVYATCGDKVYRRRLNAVGANGWDVPHKPAAPRL